MTIRPWSPDRSVVAKLVDEFGHKGLSMRHMFECTLSEKWREQKEKKSELKLNL